MSHLFHLLKTRYTQLGGLRLVREYARMGLLWPASKQVLPQADVYMPDKVPAKVEGMNYEYILKANQ